MARCLAPRERREHLDVAQHRERHGHHRVVGFHGEPVARVAAVHDTPRRRYWSIATILAPKRMRGASSGRNARRQLVGAAVDVHEVGVEAAELLAQQLEERRVHQRFLVEQEAEHLDRALGPAAERRGTRARSTGRTRAVISAHASSPSSASARTNGSSAAPTAATGAMHSARRGLEAEHARVVGQLAVAQPLAAEVAVRLAGCPW